MKRVWNPLLRRLGFELRRVPRRSLRAAPDPHELSKVEAIFADFASRQTDGGDLADVRKLRAYLTNDRMAFFDELLAAVRRQEIEFADRRIVDVGCGMGYLLRRIAATASVEALVGVDSFAEMNVLARQMCPSATIVDGTLHSMRDGFDIIFCTEVLEHLVRPHDAVAHFLERLHPGGALIATVPDGRRDQQSAGTLRDDGSAYWGHVHFWSPESWHWFLESAAGERHSVHTEQLPSGKNLGIIQYAASP